MAINYNILFLLLFYATAAFPLDAYKIVRLKDSKVIAQKNINYKMTPASTMKLLVTAAALKDLGASYVFETKFYYTGTWRNGEIIGDLIIEGSSDPRITTEKIWQITSDLSLMGLKTVRGNLIIDNSLFPGEGRDPSRKSATLTSSNAYDSPVSAFGINFGTYAVAIGENPGGKIFTQTDPIKYPHIEFKTSFKRANQTNVIVNRQTLKNKTMIKANGTVAKNSLKKVYRSVSSQKESVIIFREFLQKFGIKITGNTKMETKSKRAKYFYSHKSDLLSESLVLMNMYSNNFMAGMITRKLGGAKRLQYLIKKHFNINVEIKNGSGLDSGSKISINNLSHLLTSVYKDFSMYPVFLSTLPASKEEGSLKKRFLNFPKGHVRAKTGTLTRPQTVVGLAGYFQSKSNGICSVSIITNVKKEGVLAVQKRHESIIARY